MSEKRVPARVQRGALSADEAERLFATVDETGHTNEETAKRQRRHRSETGHGVDVDPLSEADPSGSTVEGTIAKTAVAFLVIFFAVVICGQVFWGVARRANTANLSEDVNISTVASALTGGVEWGNGFTQFPQEFSVQEADENTHRVEVTVVDTDSSDTLEALAGCQVQASALAVNALLNPNINTVVYHVNVHMNDAGHIETDQLFGFLRPTGELVRFVTFTWTKTTTENGVRFNCAITGMDSKMESELRKTITSSFTPSSIITTITGGDDVSSSADSSSSDRQSSSAATSDESKSDAGSSSAKNDGDAGTSSEETSASAK